jgi:hypothetical protein
MNVLALLALAFPLGCLALLSAVALLGVLLLAGALRGVGAIGDAFEIHWHRDEPIEIAKH